MKQKVMDAMQSFSKALMGPVLFLPIAGMLQAISSVMSNTALVTEGGVVWTLGKFINGGVGAVIGNLGILFCVGIAMSLAKKRKADAAFLALVSYLVWLAANSRWLDVAGLTIAGDTASALYGTGQTICLGYHVTDMGVFLGMILGVVVALVHNRFIDTEFEGAMAMYGNSKFVFVVLLPIVLVMYQRPDRCHGKCRRVRRVPVRLLEPRADPHGSASSSLVALPLLRTGRQHDHRRRADRWRKACVPCPAQ